MLRVACILANKFQHALCSRAVLLASPLPHTYMLFVGCPYNTCLCSGISEVGQHDHRDCEANFGNERSGIHGLADNVQFDSVVT